MKLCAVIPLATSRQDRVASAGRLLEVLGRCFPGIVIHVAARAVGGVSNKPTANSDLARALDAVSSEFVLFIEDDVVLSDSFGPVVEECLAKMEAAPSVGMISLFSRIAPRPELELPYFFRHSAGRFKQSQAVLMRRALASEWARQLRLPQSVLDWDIVLCRATIELGLHVLTRLPSVAQHRCLPSVFGHHADYTSPTFSPEG